MSATSGPCLESSEGVVLGERGRGMSLFGKIVVWEVVMRCYVGMGKVVESL